MLVEQFLVSLWCGANRFSQIEISRHDRALAALFGWTQSAGHRAVVRLFQRFDGATHSRVQQQLYGGFFSQLALKRVTLDVDSSVVPRWGKTQKGARVGYNPRRHGRASHHPLIAFVADCRMIANFWLRPGDSNSANNMLSFLKATQQQLMSPSLRWWALETGLELCEFDYQAASWARPRRMVAVRQSPRLRPSAPGKTLSLFKDDPDMRQWRYGGVCTSLTLAAVELWRSYRGRADCENRIKELKADFGLESFNLRELWATEAALTTTMLAYNLMSLFRQSTLRGAVQPMMATLRHQVFATPAWSGAPSDPRANVYTLALPRQRRAWFAGLWSVTLDPPRLPTSMLDSS